MTTYLTMRPSAQQVSHIWRTTIQKSLNGSEKRSAIRTYPSLKLTTSYGIGNHQKSMWLKGNLFHNINEIWAIPIWADYTTLTTTASGGTATLNVAEADYRHFEDDRQAIVIDVDDWTSYEAVTISGTTSNTVVVSGTLVSTWDAGSLVLPLWECRINPAQIVSRQVQSVDTYSIVGMEAYESQNTFTYTVPSTSVTTYSGYDVFDKAPNSPIEYNFYRPYELTQYHGLGDTETYYADDQTDMPIKASFIYNTKESIRGLYDFFDNKQGRLNTFWMPSWNMDLILTAAVGSGDVILNVENIDYTGIWLPNDLVGRHLYIQLPDQSYVLRKITGATSTTVTIDSSVGTAINDYTHAYISFLNFSRFDVDELMIDFHTNNVTARTFISFVGVVEETI